MAPERYAYGFRRLTDLREDRAALGDPLTPGDIERDGVGVESAASLADAEHAIESWVTSMYRTGVRVGELIAYERETTDGQTAYSMRIVDRRSNTAPPPIEGAGLRHPLVVAFVEGGLVQGSVEFEGVGLPELIVLDFDTTESSDPEECNDFAVKVSETAELMKARGQLMDPAWIEQADNAVIPLCDICRQPEGEGEADWNGETGNHETCEAEEAKKAKVAV